MSEMIDIKSISFGYKKSKGKQFDNFSLTFEKGSVYGLLGKNGVGKSTLLYLITGLLLPQSGVINFDGTNVSKRFPKTLQEMYLVPEEFELPAISLRKYVEYNSPFYPNFSISDLEKYLKCFEMDINVDLGALSMGQKKKVYMSFALATNTSLLLMDEPTNGLDIPGKSQFRKFISTGMNDNKTIIISTHQVNDVDKLLDHVIIMDKNNVLLNESVNDVCDKLLFVDSSNDVTLSDTLFETQTIQGKSAILANLDHNESAINLELLFNATLCENEKITQLFHK